MCIVSLYMLAILCCHTIDWDIFLRYWCLSQIYYIINILLLGTDGILSCIIVGINHHPPPTGMVPHLHRYSGMSLKHPQYILDVVKQLDLAAVEEVETSGTSWEEMVAAEEPNCQAVEDMLLGDSNEDAPSAASQ